VGPFASISDLIKVLPDSDITCHYATFHGKCHLAILDPFDMTEPDSTCLRANLSPIKDGPENSVVEQVQL
jgi:hypothetical protein